jgi:hypothetical protein
VQPNYTYISHGISMSDGSIPPTGTSYDKTSGNWTLPTLLDGQSATLTVTTTIISPAVNWAEVIAVKEVDPDSRPASCNDSVSSCTEDDDASAPSADLSLTQSVSPFYDYSQ